MSIGRVSAAILRKPLLNASTLGSSAKALPLKAAPKFSGGLSAAPIKAGRLLEKLDFTALGASPVAQIGVIFSSLIMWRLLAANERRRASVSKRWNELRENLMRDLLGFAFWFLGVPVLQRLYLSAVSRHNSRLKGVLIQHVQAESKKPQGVLQWLNAFNPLSNRYIPSSQQVKDQMHQALRSLEKAGLGKTHPVYLQTRADYLHLVKHRNFATALGLGSTILLLGVGINLLNFYLTRKNVTAGSQPNAGNAGALPGPNPFTQNAVGTPWSGTNSFPFAKPVSATSSPFLLNSKPFNAQAGSQYRLPALE